MLRGRGCVAVADPLGADMWFGVPPTEQARCADVLWAGARPMADVDLGDLRRRRADGR